MKAPKGRRRLAAIAAAIVAALAGLTLTLTIDGDGGATVTIKGGTDRHGAPVTVTVPKAAVTAASESAELNENLRAEQGVTRADVRASDRAASSSAPRIVGPPPAAAPYQRGCITRQLPRNYSYRSGVRPSLVVVHLPVAYNRGGWSDVNGVWGFLARAATSASANYLNDAEGHCILAVAETLKAWAQAGYNSATACSIEQQAYGNEAAFMAPAGLRQLARIVHDCAHRWGIPLRRFIVAGGRVIRSGVGDHVHLGREGGGHQDVRQFGAGCRHVGVFADTWPCIDRIIAAARAIDAPAIAARWHGRCRRYVATRAKLERREHVSTAERRKAHQLRELLVKARLRCAGGRAVSA